MKPGIDIEGTSRFDLPRTSTFLKNNFTDSELDYAFSKGEPKITLCGLFCAKEAVIKTLERQDILLKEIEVRHDDNAKPYIVLLKEGIIDKKISISISHTSMYAVAIATID